MIDLVYLIHEADNEPLRYSLRSVASAPFRKVWIVGVLPDWATGVEHLPTVPAGEKFADIRHKLETVTRDRRVAAQIVVMNDDYFATTPIAEWRAWHMGSTAAYLAERGNLRNSWWEAMRDTAEWMQSRGHVDILCYAGHIPLLYSKAKLHTLLTEYPQDRRLLDVGLYPAAGAGGEGELALNAKCGPDEIAKLNDPRMPPWVSTNDAAWAGAIGDRIRAMYSSPSRFEK